MEIVIENLKEALMGESKAKKKYKLFSKRAMEENLPKVAKLFKAISSAEAIHIKNHLRALTVITGNEADLDSIVKINEQEMQNLVKTTQENLLEAIEGETYETKKMYKGFVKNAKKTKANVAELSFSLARQAEKVHADIFSDVLKNLEKGKPPLDSSDIYVCQICGNVEFENPPSVCPVCDHSEKFFEKIE